MPIPRTLEALLLYLESDAPYLADAVKASPDYHSALRDLYAVLALARTEATLAERTACLEDARAVLRGAKP